jgi:hypothetical protein
MPANNGVVPTPRAAFYVDGLLAWASWKSVYAYRGAAHAEALGGQSERNEGKKYLFCQGSCPVELGCFLRAGVARR